MSLFQADTQIDRSLLPTNCIPRINDEKLHSINAKFELDEIKQALFDMAPFKASDPDGIHAGFFQNVECCWRIAKPNGNEILCNW